MLSDRICQLLTGFVDGELSNRQRKAVQRLLRRSPEARTLLRKLRQDAAHLRSLPRPHAAPDVSEQVVRAIRQRGLQPSGRRSVAAGRPTFWYGYAAAAMVLLAVGLGSFLFFSHPKQQKNGADQIAEVTVPQDQPKETGRERTEETAKVIPETPKGVGKAGGPANEMASAGGVKMASPDESSWVKITPVEPPVVAAPIENMELFKPTVVEAPFSLIRDVRQLDAAKLRSEIEKETALRVELPCREAVKGFNRLKADLKEFNISLLVDAEAENRLSKPRLKTHYAILLEDLSADELARLLAHLGAEDKKAAEAKPKSDGQFSKMVANRLTDTDRKELSDLLHVERPLLDRVEKIDASKPAGNAQRSALAVTFNPVRPAANSKEVKRYFETRKVTKADAIQVLLVIREPLN
jgi:hypothetical protein